MLRTVSGIVIVLVLAPWPALNAIAQESTDHRDYRRAMHQAANQAVSQLVQSGNWDLETGPPRTAGTGDGALRYIGAPAGYPIQLSGAGSVFERAERFVRHHAAAFGLYTQRSDLAYTRYTESHGRVYYRFGQTFDTVPIHGAEIIVQTNGAAIEAIFARVLRDTFALEADEHSMTPALTRAQAEQAALDARFARLSTLRNARLDELDAAEGLTTNERDALRTNLENTQLTIVSAGEFIILAPGVLGKDGPPRLAYRTGVRSAPAALLDETVYIDARTGAVLHTATRIRGIDRNIYDTQGGTTPTSTPVRTENDPPVSDPDVDDNFDLFEVAYDYFNAAPFNWTGFDGNDASIHSHVHWGTVGHAEWHLGSTSFRFGTDDYARAADIVGHEYAHAVLDYAWPGHESTGETGAIAESLADLFGEFIQWEHATPTTKWLIGEDVTGGPLRDMADPAEYDQPSWYGSTIYYHGEDEEVYVSTNSGVGNKLWYLLTDGDTFRDITVTGLGEAAVADLVWEAVNNQLLSGADYGDLYIALRDAADVLFSSGTTPTLETALTEIDNAAMAVGIATDLDTVPIAKGGSNIYDWRSHIDATTSDGYPRFKRIPYKVYVPEDRLDLGSRGEADWPLDVIILSHGAGMNREIATGWDANGNGDFSDTGDVEGLATYWANQGYIVVAPTYKKRRHLTGSLWVWEFPHSKDNVVKFVTDFIHAVFIRPEEFFVDRVRDLEFIRENLGSLINVGSTTGAYDATEVDSEVILAGHSFGAVTTMLASGSVLTLGFSGDVEIDLEAAGFVREFQEGAGQADDYGAFVSAAAYVLLSGGFNRGSAEHTIIDSSRPNLTGKDFIQKPLLVMTAENDITAAPGNYFNPVTKAPGINEFPSYGVAVDGANHLTTVTQFATQLHSFRSWSATVQLISGLGLEFSTLEERNAFNNQTTHNALSDYWDKAFFGAGVQSAEESRLDTVKAYTLSLFDAFVRAEYSGSSALSFLNRAPSVHEGDTNHEVLEFGFSKPTRTMFIRDVSGVTLAQFQDDGNVLVLEGTFSASQTPNQTSVSEWVVKNSSGTVLAILSASTGNLTIKGTKTIVENLESSGGTKEFVIRSANDTGDDAQIIIDSNGNLKLRGDVYTDSDL